jgi:hypothetical protein
MPCAFNNSFYDETTPSQPNVLAQTDVDATSYRFPLCVFDSVAVTDVDENTEEFLSFVSVFRSASASKQFLKV